MNYVEMGGLYRDRDLWLWKDGLHLNWDGADRMGREIYKHFFTEGRGGRNELNRGKATKEGRVYWEIGQVERKNCIIKKLNQTVKRLN